MRNVSNALCKVYVMRNM